MQADEWQVINYHFGRIKEKDKQEIILCKHLLTRLTDKPIRGWILLTDQAQWMEV